MYISPILSSRIQSTTSVETFRGKIPNRVEWLAGSSLPALLLGSITNMSDHYKDNGITQPSEMNTELKNLLNKQGISHTESDAYSLSARTKYGTLFKITPPIELSEVTSKIILANELKGATSHFGAKPFVECVNDLKRGDIICAGLRIKNPELLNIDVEQKKKTAFDLKMELGRPIHTKDLFCIGSEAFYYDKDKKTVYSIRITEDKLESKPLRTCKFITDKNGNAIGFEQTMKSPYSSKYETKTYEEQHEPFNKLTRIPDPNDFQDYADANRFGNNYNRDCYMTSIKKIVERLKQSGIENVSEDDIVVVTTMNKGLKRTTLNYYDGRVGQTRVFDRHANYIDLIAYTRDLNGVIRNCYSLR